MHSGANRGHVLVSTTVVEVGVDVPNATLMIIMDAERFGLSQLHQLRGRVGRGEHQSYCVLIADPKSETGRERMKVMTETDDGFEVARRDLELARSRRFLRHEAKRCAGFQAGGYGRPILTMLEQARDDAAELTASADFWTEAPYCEACVRFCGRMQLFQGDLLD